MENKEIKVTRQWLEGLLQQADRVKNAQEDQKRYEIASLLGYIKSANFILYGK